MKYLNKTIYTDVESWMVTDIDEAAGTAMATPVEKKIKPFMVPGGFTGYCPNLYEEFAAAEPIACGKAFPIIRKNGVWGYMRDCSVLAVLDSQLNISLDEFLKQNPAWTEIEPTARGERMAVLYERTPKGKIKRTFEKLGKLSDHCDYFYDYNF